MAELSNIEQSFDKIKKEPKAPTPNPWLDRNFSRVDRWGKEPGIRVDDIPERLGLLKQVQDLGLWGNYFVDLRDTPSNYGKNEQFVKTDGSGKLTFDWPYWVKAGSTIYYKKGNVAVGLSTPLARFHTYGDNILDGAVTINESGRDKDFRVEGDTELNLLFCDASTDRVAVGTNTPLCRTHIRGVVCADYAGLHPDTVLLLENDDNVTLQFQCSTGGEARIRFCDDDFNPSAGMIDYSFGVDYMVFGVATSINMYLTPIGLGVGDIIPTNELHVSGPGTDEGGLAGGADVVARFRQTTAGHCGISIDALAGYDPVLYLAENGEAQWDIRNDATESDEFQIRYQGRAVANLTCFSMTTAGIINIVNDFILTGTTAPTISIISTDDSDPALCIKTTNTAHEICLALDESAGADHVDFIGQTADVDTYFHIIAQSGYTAKIGVQVGSYRGELICGAAGHVSLLNITTDLNLVLGIKDGEVNKTITWNAADDKLQHSAGLFNFDDDNLLTTGTLGAGQATLAKSTLADDGRGLSSIFTLSADPAKSDGIALYTEGHIGDITTDGPTYGGGIWLNIDSGATLGADVRALDIGIYERGADCTGGNAYGLAIHLDFDSTNSPAAIYPFRLNCEVSGATPDALMFAANKSALAVTEGDFPYNNYLKIVVQDGTVYRIPLITEGATQFIALHSSSELRFYDNGNYVGFEAPSLSANQIWVLPTADGPANEVLGTDNSGNLIWRTHDELAGFVASEHLPALDEDDLASDSDTNVATQQSIKKYVDDQAVGGVNHAILDGSVHSDSVADAVTRGSIIYGNATPKWDELVLGGANTFLGSDGTDLSYRSAAQVMASLSGAVGAAFSFNSQNITSVGTVDGRDISAELPTKTTGAWSKSIGSGGDYASWALMIAAMPDMLSHAVTVTIEAGTTLTAICSLKNKHGLTTSAAIDVKAEKYFPTSGAIPTADSATATTLRDAALATAALGDDYFIGCWVFIVDGTGTDNGFILITDYTDATGDVHVAAWTGTEPDNTSRYIIVGALVDGGSARANALVVNNNTVAIDFRGIGVKDTTDIGVNTNFNTSLEAYYCGIYNAGEEGIHLRGITYTHLRYCGFVKCGNTGIEASGCDYLELENNGISDNVVAGVGLRLGTFAYLGNNFGDDNGTWGTILTQKSHAEFGGTECSGSSGDHQHADGDFKDVEVTGTEMKPGQPSFLVYNAVKDANVTGDGTGYTVEFDTEIYDQGGDFATPTFTAPVDGRYLLVLNITLDDLNTDAYSRIYLTVNTSNRTYFPNFHSGENFDVSGRQTLSASIIVDMDADDTATIVITASGGTKTVDLEGGATYCTFSGALIC